jgi:hypothetical protein
MKRLLAVSIIVLLAACDGSTEPPKVNVTGNWAIAWPSMTGSGGYAGLTCSISGMTLSVTQTGQSFSGTYSSSTITCNGNAVAATAGVVVSGTVSGNSVSFDLDNATTHQTGTISGNTMSGSAAWTDATGSLSGTWSANR